MRPAKLGAAVVLGVVACSVGVALHSWIATERTEAKSREVARALAAAGEKLSALKGRLDAAEKRASSGLAQGEVGGPAKPKGSAVWQDWLERLKTDPRTQARFLEYEKSRLALTFGPLFKDLHLSADQVSQCEAIIIRRQEADMDLNAALQQQGIPGSDAAAQKLYADTFAEYKAALTGLLGEDGFKEWNDYEQALPARMAVLGFAGMATLNGMPLSPDQVQQLAGAATEARLGPDGPDWSTIEARAGAVLSPSQLELLKAGEFSGIGGYGSKYQHLLNAAITRADQEDLSAGVASSGVAASRNPVPVIP
jgi:hypothetical protein